MASELAACLLVIDTWDSWKSHEAMDYRRCSCSRQRRQECGEVPGAGDTVPNGQTLISLRYGISLC